MEDLDLDELDHAVTQLMDKPGKKAAKKPVAPKPEAPKVAPEPPKATPDEPVSVAVTQKTPVTRSSLAKPAPRKRMRPGAMDIIQRPQPPRPPKREGAPLQPTKPVAPEPVQPAPLAVVADTPAPVPEVSDDLLASLNLLEDSNKTVKPKAEPTPPAAAEAWPDPIDLHDFSDKKDETPEPAPDEPAEEPEEVPTLVTEPTPIEEPATSPFVTTKVEKRPLGAYTTPAPAPEEPADIPIPKEETSKAEMAETSLQSSHHLAAPDQPEADMDDLRQMSIPQQYHTTQAKPSESVHNVFDTKEYHAPPQPMRTERHGSPWLVTAVVVLIVLFVGFAAVGYLMLSGMLDISKIW